MPNQWKIIVIYFLQLYNKDTFIQLIFRSLENWLRGLVFNGYQSMVFAKHLNSSSPQKRVSNHFSLLEFRWRDLRRKAKVWLQFFVQLIRHFAIQLFSTSIIDTRYLSGYPMSRSWNRPENTNYWESRKMPVIGHCFLNSVASSLARLAAMLWACQRRVYPDNAFSG